MVTSAGDPKITEGSILTGSWVLKILKLGFCKVYPEKNTCPCTRGRGEIHSPELVLPRQALGVANPGMNLVSVGAP